MTKAAQNAMQEALAAKMPPADGAMVVLAGAGKRAIIVAADDGSVMSLTPRAARQLAGTLATLASMTG